MIPPKLVRFINEEADVGMMGTRSAENRPNVHRIFGFLAGEDGRHITAFVPHQSLPNLAEAIADNGRAAITVGHMISHESYQMKGVAAPPALPTDTELAHFEVYRERFVKVLVAFGMPEEVARTAVGQPERVVKVEVEDVFLQTPGPGAGKRLSEEEAP